MPTPARFRSTIASIVLQPDDLRELRAFHKALADVNRLRIVRRLAEARPASRSSSPTSACPSRSSATTSSACAPPASSRPAGSAARPICTLRPEAFGEVAARERAILGIAS